MFNLEASIQNWLKQFSKHRAFDHGSLMEMELHLRDHIEDLISNGSSDEEAFFEATASFGEIPSMADEDFSNQQRKKSIGTMLYATLFKNYSKTTIRSMMRNPLSSFINIIGLAAAIGIWVFTYGFAQWVYRTDQFHKNKEEIHLATFHANIDGTLQQNGMTPYPFGAMIKQDFSSINEICRVKNGNVIVKYNDNVFHERLHYVDPSFLEFFTFPLKWGAKGSLTDVNSVILSEDMSIKYFDDENPIGQTLLIKFDENTTKTFVITGVAEEFPKSRSFDFNFLINFDNLVLTSNLEQNWGHYVDATFVRLDKGSSINSIQSGLTKYVKLHNAIQHEWKVSAYSFVSLQDLHKKSSDMRNSIASGSRENYISIVFLSAVGIFMLALACFNYVNIAIVSATRRLKEIGVRKTIGASRKNVVIQFLSENLILTAFAMVLGLMLGTSLFIPWFEGLFNFDMGFSLLDPELWLFLPTILVITGVVSGLYPSIFVSRFPLTGILKKKIAYGKKNRATKVILGFQLVLACLFITSAVMFTMNSQYMIQRDWGYEKEYAMYTPVPDLAGFKRLKAEMSEHPEIVSFSGSKHHIGRSHQTKVVETLDRQYEVDILEVGARYFTTMGISILEGRSFEEKRESEKNAVVVNNLLVHNLNMENPIGFQLKMDDRKYTIVGVAENLHSYSFSSALTPTIFKLADEADFSYLSLRVNKGSESNVYTHLQESWARLFPEIPFQGGYQEDVWGFYYEEMGIHGKVWRGIASIAIFLAGLGLYGLVSLNVAGRRQEFSIRKVLGASISSIGKDISKEYLWLFGISLGLGAPSSYYLMKFIFDFAYVYHMPIKFWGVGFAILVLVITLLLVLAIQLSRINSSNPVLGLNEE